MLSDIADVIGVGVAEVLTNMGSNAGTAFNSSATKDIK